MFFKKPDILAKSDIDPTACQDCYFRYEIHQVSRGWFRWGFKWRVQGGSSQLVKCCKVQKRMRETASICMEK